MFSVLVQHIQRVGYNNWGICERDSRVSHPVPCTPGWDVILSSGQRPPIMHAAQCRLEWWRGVSRASGGVRPSSQHKLGVHDKVKTTTSGKQNRPLEPLRVRAVHALQWYSCENMFVTPNSFVSFSCALQMMNLRRWEKGLARSWRYLYTCLLDVKRMYVQIPLSNICWTKTEKLYIRHHTTMLHHFLCCLTQKFVLKCTW